jgi:hypothetical protein
MKLIAVMVKQTDAAPKMASDRVASNTRPPSGAVERRDKIQMIVPTLATAIAP